MLYTQLRSFHAVAKEGGFTAASKVLNVGQPTITSQVKGLEERFGVRLFHRQGHKIQRTDSGEALFKIARRMMSLETDALDLLNAYGGLLTGQLKIGAVGPYHVTEMLALFSEQYPGIKLSVTVGNSMEMVERLLDFSVDVAVLAHVEDDERICAMPFSRHPVVLFANRDHPFAGRKSVQLKDLQGQKMVLREKGSTTRLSFEDALNRAGVSIDPVMEIGSREAVWFAVERGIGLGVVSDIEFIPHPNLCTITLGDAEIYTTAHVNCLADRRESALISAFFNVADEMHRSQRHESL